MGRETLKFYLNLPISLTGGHMKHEYELNNQEVEIMETEYADGLAMVIEAYYVESEMALSEDELLELEDLYQDELAQRAYESLVDRAHDMMDMER